MKLQGLNTYLNQKYIGDSSNKYISPGGGKMDQLYGYGFGS